MFDVLSVRENTVRVGFRSTGGLYSVFVTATVSGEAGHLVVNTPRNCFIREDLHPAFIGAVLEAYEKTHVVKESR